jgi:Tat protein secretion system quality control protein TatD with DNase activity
MNQIQTGQFFLWNIYPLKLSKFPLLSSFRFYFSVNKTVTLKNLKELKDIVDTIISDVLRN